jgi:adenylate cyclase
MLSAAVAIMVLGGAIFAGLRWLVSRRSPPIIEIKPEEDPLLALPTGPVVAVLPFENLSREPDQEYFSDGLTEGIITALSRFKDLFVIARNSTFRYKAQAVDVRQLNKELGARYVLEGSVQKAGETLRVTAQLLDAKDGTHLWAETYDRALSSASIFAVQDEITEQVAATIAGPDGVISRERVAQIKEKPTHSLDAYECVLRANAYYRDNYVASEHAKVRDALERVVASEPDYAQAWAFLCFTYLDEYKFYFNPRPQPLDRALSAAKRAITADPTSQRAHQALAAVYFYLHELDGFFAEAERAIALNPNNVRVLGAMGEKLQQVGDKRGVELVKKAMALDPYHPTVFYYTLADDHFQQGEYEEALAAVQRLNMPDFYTTQAFLAAVYSELGRKTEAHTAVERARTLYPGLTIEEWTEEMRKWNRPDAVLRKFGAALRKAGLPD